MSGIGTITAEEVFSERVELQPRTSDPSGTEEGEGWIRSDIAPDSNQIATFRVDTGGSTIDVPILQTGTSTDGVVEALRLSVGGTLGYVPAIPESKAAFPALRLQHNGQVYGWHDARGETAFFDVAIDSTNSPVTEGNTLTVDYSVDNTGGSLDDTQDIRLEVGSTERDRDNDVTVASGGSTTGQLSWGSAAQGSYTASVLSDDDVASTSVSVESAIPDTGLDHLWWGLSISDISTYPDEIGSLDMSANGDPQLGAINSRSASVYDGVDDYHAVDSAPALGSGDVWTAVVVVDLNNNGSLQSVFSLGADSTTSGGFDLQARFNDDAYAVAHTGSDLVIGAPSLGTGPEVWVATYDGSNVVLDVNKTQILDSSINSPNPIQSKTTIGSLGRNTNWTDGAIGAVGYEPLAADTTRRDELTDIFADEFNISL